MSYNVTIVTIGGDRLHWLMFQYNVPNKPSKLRVYVWRKLKALRAQPLVEGMYVLPLNDKTKERLEWLCAEVFEMGGEAVLWKAACLSDRQEEALISRFHAEARKGYEKIQELLLRGAEENHKEWLDHIIRLYADARYYDYFDAYRDVTIHTQIETHRRGEA